MEKGRSTEIITPKFRAAFVQLWEPKAVMEGQDPKYSVVMLFPKSTNLSELKRITTEAIRDKWGDNKPRGLKTPFKDGDAVDENGDLLYAYEGYAGMIVCSTTSKYPVGIVNSRRQLITDRSTVYSGCWGRARIRAIAYDLPQSKGVSFALINFQKLEDDEPFGGGINAEDDFDDEISERGDQSVDNNFDF